MTTRAARRRLLICLFWPLFGAFSGVQIQISMLAHHHSWAALIGYQVLVWSLWIPISFAIGALLSRAPLRVPRPAPLAVHLVAAALFGLAHIAAWVAAELILVPYDVRNPVAFGPRFERITTFQLPLEVLLYGLVLLGYLLDESSARARDREQKAAQLETSLAEARLHALELQTQPHFLFNTLNGIGALVRAGRAKEALSMIGGLSDLLRYAMDRAGGGVVPLEDEARTAERYLEIQRLRFPDRLSYHVDVREAPRGAVPALLLQPLVENAVRHGLAQSDAPGRITVHAARRNGELVVEVFNTGRLSPARTDGIGVSNTVARLSQLHGDKARFELSDREGGVMARVTLPWSEAP